MTQPRLAAPALLLGFFIAAGLGILGYCLQQGIVQARLSDRYVTARGLVERLEKADRGTCEISFSVGGNDLTTLYPRLTQDTDAVKKFFERHGFEPAEITTNASMVSDLHNREFGNAPLPADRYRITSSVVLRSSKVDALQTLVSKTDELLKERVSISHTNTRFYLDRFKELRPQLIAEATQNAQAVANSFAKTTGSTLGGIRKANQGTITITTPDASPSQDYDDATTSLIKKIRVVATIEFYLK